MQRHFARSGDDVSFDFTLPCRRDRPLAREPASPATGTVVATADAGADEASGGDSTAGDGGSGETRGPGAARPVPGPRGKS